MLSSRASGARTPGPSTRAAAVAIVGRGRLGSGLARALRAAGVDLHITPGRAPSTHALRAASVWLLAVPDPLVAEVALRVARARVLGAGAVVLHTSASVPLEALRPLAERGAAVGVMHPLVSFASKRHPPALGGSTFVLAGAPRAVTAARRLAASLGARTITRPVHGARYHAAAAVLSGGAATLAGAATAVFVDLGMSPSESRRAVASLLGSVAENVGRLGMPAALTGPFARGDAAAVAAQTAALAGSPIGDLYVALAPAMLEQAALLGLDPEVRRALGRALAR